MESFIAVSPQDMGNIPGTVSGSPAESPGNRGKDFSSPNSGDHGARSRSGSRGPKQLSSGESRRQSGPRGMSASPKSVIEQEAPSTSSNAPSIPPDEYALEQLKELDLLPRVLDIIERVRNGQLAAKDVYNEVSGMRLFTCTLWTTN